MRILASDLDGTLVEKNHMSEDNLRGIQVLKEAGHKFIISTGRVYNEVEKLIEKYNIEYDYLVVCNGSLVINSEKDVILDEWISNKIATKITEEYYDKDNILMYLDNSKETLLMDNENVDEAVKKSVIGYFKGKTKIGNMSDIKDNYKMLSIFAIDENIERAENIKKSIIDKYGKYVQAFRNQCFIDIVPKGCSKGDALLKILEIEQKSSDDLYVVGDSLNDISMFNITKNSFTFNNAEKEVKKYANKYVDYVHEVVKNILN